MWWYVKIPKIFLCNTRYMQIKNIEKTFKKDLCHCFTTLRYTLNVLMIFPSFGPSHYFFNDIADERWKSPIWAGCILLTEPEITILWTYSYWFPELGQPPCGCMKKRGDMRRMLTSWYSAFWTRAVRHKLWFAASIRSLEAFVATYIWGTSMNRRWRLPTWRCNANSNVEAWPACCWKAACGWHVNAESGISMRSPSMWQHETSMRFDFMRAKASSIVGGPSSVDVPRGQQCRPSRSGVQWRNKYDSIVTMFGLLGCVWNSFLAKAHLVARGYLSSQQNVVEV